MFPLYPVFLDLAGRACLVVGGGAVAERKVEGLLAAGARVTVVSPDLTPGLRGHADRRVLEWTSRAFGPSDLDGMELAFVATSDPEVNRRAAGEAKARGIRVNVADDPEACDFHVPAVLRRGPVSVAVSTGGASPALAAWLRNRLETAIPEGLGDLVEVLGSLREMTPQGARLSGEAQRELLESGILDDLGRGDWEEADRKAVRFLGRGFRIAELARRRSTETT
jgi:siroheme synthase-like protein